MYQIRDCSPPEAEGNIKQVRIIADEAGDFTYIPSTLHVHHSERVQWYSCDGPFGLSFIDNTPFEKTNFSSKIVNGVNITEPVGVRDDAIGHHHYAVAVVRKISPDNSAQDEFAVELDAGCPDIIVQ